MPHMKHKYFYKVSFVFFYNHNLIH